MSINKNDNNCLGYKKSFNAYLVIALLLLTMMFSGCFCGPKKKMPQYTADGKLKIVFWHSMAGKLGEILNSMVNEFNKNNKDNIFVKTEFIGEYATLNQKIAAAVFAEIPPHIAQVFETWTLKLKNEEAIVALDKYMDSAEVGIDKNDIVPALLKNVTIDGKVYSMPFNKSISALYYNKRLFAAAGLDPEKPPVTWDEFIEYGKKLTMLERKGFLFNDYINFIEYEKQNGQGSFPPHGSKYTVIWGNAFISDPWSFENYIFQNGGRILDETGKKAMINSPEALEAADYLVDKLKKHRFALRTSGREHQNEFVAERVAMIEGTIVSKVFMQSKLRFPFGMANIPYNKINTSVLSGTNVAIFAYFGEEEILAAWKFIKWFTDTEQTARWGIETTYMPVRKSAYETEAVKQTIEKDPNMKVALTMLEKIDFEPLVAPWFECRAILGKATEALVLTNKSPKEILDAAAAEMNHVLATED
jgi:ABC-type glycerol-3-phosphate transport system substrate-binding protein